MLQPPLVVVNCALSAVQTCNLTPLFENERRAARLYATHNSYIQIQSGGGLPIASSGWRIIHILLPRTPTPSHLFHLVGLRTQAYKGLSHSSPFVNLPEASTSFWVHFLYSSLALHLASHFSVLGPMETPRACQ